MRKNTRKVRIEFGNCDPARIVYYPNYVVWIDQSTHHLFDVAGISIRELQDSYLIQVPLVDLSVKFSGPAEWGDEIVIESGVSRWGSSSFDVSHAITSAATGATLVTARETRVCVRIDPAVPKNLATCPIPEAMRAALS